MRSLMYLLAAAALAAAFMSPPAQAVQKLHGELGRLGLGAGSGGYLTGPYWRGGPTDRLSIWRYGYYQGNDPDRLIRLQIMRDPTNGQHP